MMSERITDHPILGTLETKEKITFIFNGKSYEGLADDTIASALLANGIRTLRKHEESGTPRGIYCNIGHCFECRVTVNNETNIRACLTPVTDGMVIEAGDIVSAPLDPNQEGNVPRTYEEYEEWKKEKEQ